MNGLPIYWHLQEKKCSKWDRLSSASIIQYPLIWGSAWPMDTPFQVRLPSSMDTKMSLSDSSTLRLSAQTWIKRLETAAKESSSPSLASPSSEATLCSKCWSPKSSWSCFNLYKAWSEAWWVRSSQTHMSTIPLQTRAQFLHSSHNCLLHMAPWSKTRQMSPGCRAKGWSCRFDCTDRKSPLIVRSEIKKSGL